ncbi:glutathione S-transferase [Stella humosa]|uniref:Glutathione S-transferase n=1 Tax=Stella humosa TaxID=94 RepID=A0A3N1MEE7_9PROT|nr:glutathione S-transferase N-terminal domain-containing protein [Stella humosa]ROQ01669.1 glutathione S-transferase [Stella humosa]BBK32051.1 glutathione S-transferase [Stella humosa]
MLRLFYAPATCALATHIALIEAGADYDLIRLSFAAEDQRKPAFLAINPKGRVPALVTEQGVLTETPALLAYVAQRYPAARLAPFDDAFALARVQAFNSYLCATLHVAHSHRMRGYRWADEPDAILAMQRKVPASVSQCFEVVERELTGPWVMGGAYTICDPYLFTLAQWMEADGVDTDRFPNVIAHRRRCAERAAVQRALAEESGMA